TGVFWSTSQSDLRRENLITYTPNESVKPIVTYGSVLTEKNTVSRTARQLEAAGYRVVAGMNGDFYNVNNGLPIGVVITEGELRSSDAGYYAIGFRADGTAVLGRPQTATYLDLTPRAPAAAEPDAEDPAEEPAETPEEAPVETAEVQQVLRKVAGINKARVSTGGIYIYTRDFNAAHTTGTVEPGVDAVCSVVEGRLAIGQTMKLRVERVTETSAATPVEEGQVVLSANVQSGVYFTSALKGLTVGQEITLTCTSAEPVWNEVEYAVGALYSLVENGAVVSGLPAGANPRTAIGQKKDGTLIFYTIDGRQSDHSIGASMQQVAERLIELGCVTALCLDGGGSTTLAVTQPDALTATLLNLPSGGQERAVSNQIFLVAQAAPTGRLGSFHMSAENRFVLAGGRVEIRATAIDTNYIPMPDAQFDLWASAGTLEGNVLTTPEEGGDIIVTAESEGRQGITTVYAIADPDQLLICSDSGETLDALSVSPGTTMQLRASAFYGNIVLKTDPEQFTWSVTGDIGTVDENGVFRAHTPGIGTVTVTAAGKTARIWVAVSEMPLMRVEDFEQEETIFGGEQDENVSITKTRAEEFVRLGRAAGAFAYTLAEDENRTMTATLRTDVPLNSAYSAVNLWVYGDGSGNLLELLYHHTEDGEQRRPVGVLDFTGWQPFAVELWNADALLGLVVNGGQAEETYEESTAPAETVVETAAEDVAESPAETPAEEAPERPAPEPDGVIYIDQIVSSFCGVTDQEAPVISLSENAGQFTAKIKDGVDGILPADALRASYDGAALEFQYDAERGVLTAVLPESDGAAHRVTVTAADASGNLGRASLDLPAGEDWTSRFSDMQGHWSEAYVDYLHTAGITGGYADGTFHPDEKISRAQFATMLFRYLKLDAEQYAAVELPFADLDKIPGYALPAIKALYTEGVVNGSTGADGLLYFNPGNTLTRAQAAAMLGRTMEKGYASVELPFTDAAAIPNYAKSHVQTLAAIGVFGGYGDGTFRPGSPLTRGQTAKILYHLL
ncbi:MAG: surface layer protein, partial [Ruminococcaceae bacterium]|nr:surface layer protein [Oscillospiraceae bacterium]